MRQPPPMAAFIAAAVAASRHLPHYHDIDDAAEERAWRYAATEFSWPPPAYGTLDELFTPIFSRAIRRSRRRHCRAATIPSRLY